MKRLDIRDTVAIRMIKEYFGSDVADIAYERTKQSIKNGAYTDDGEDIERVDGLFTWFSTPEGHGFWELIHNTVQSYPKFGKVEPEVVRDEYKASEKIYENKTLNIIQKLYGVEVADLALRRAEEYLVREKNPSSVFDRIGSCMTLIEMFCWADTIEGRDYWDAIHEKVRGELYDDPV